MHYQLGLADSLFFLFMSHLQIDGFGFHLIAEVSRKVAGSGSGFDHLEVALVGDSADSLSWPTTAPTE